MSVDGRILNKKTVLIVNRLKGISIHNYIVPYIYPVGTQSIFISSNCLLDPIIREGQTCTHPVGVSSTDYIFEASALWANAFYRSKCLYVCLCVCLRVCPSHFLTPFNGLFAPTSRSPMSKLVRYSESLGKGNGKKWSKI